MPRSHRFDPEGFSAVHVENVHQVANLRADLIAVYQPVNSQELFAIERIALAQHSLLRAYRLEAGLMTCALEEGLELPANPRILRVPELTQGPVARDQNRNYWMAFGLQRMTRTTRDWPLLLRYQVQAERLYRRAIEEFERLRALRSVLPDQDLSEPEPDPVIVEQPEADPQTQPEPELEAMAPAASAPSAPIAAGSEPSANSQEPEPVSSDLQPEPEPAKPRKRSRAVRRRQRIDREARVRLNADS